MEESGEELTLRPAGLCTSQAQPDPKAVFAALEKSLRKFSKLPKSFSISSSKRPVGLPPPLAFMHCEVARKEGHMRVIK